MTNLKFFKCSHCGNVGVLAVNMGVPVVCCGEKMTELVPNSTEAATEKHIPVVSVNGNKLTVEVGSVTHPMTPEHHISFVAVEFSDGRYGIKPFETTEAPVAEFIFGGVMPVRVYEYCNLHGLWVKEI
ncbi:MAG: desulfoferrodoxin family protein [Oscillospiraceae bacterium]